MLLRSVHLLALSAGVAWAQQAPLRSTGGSCLSSSNANRATALTACCPTDATEGKGTVDGTVFTYACGQYAKPYESTGQNTASPRECAQLCAQDPTCVAASWAGRNGLCYVTRDGTSFGPMPARQFILLAKSEEPPADDPSAADPAATAQCNDEKDAIRREMTSQCEAEVQGQKAAHEGSLKDAEAQCEAQKSRQVAAAREQCDSDKAALVRDRKVCEAEKGRLKDQSAAAEKKCKSEVADLEKKVKDLEDKGRPGRGSGPGGFVQTGDPACENINTYSRCQDGCKRFAIDGVEYELKCSTYAERTQTTRSDAYDTINECLANKCNKESKCLGVSWTPDVSTLPGNICETDVYRD
ncbi:hypothetical protein CGCA056_v000320 [Colletotrichum aenigma]|uniref:uncharacterized protein n=1 Tax=Colletotrichum aenigma TaxID=1215731 RepID=UPI0018727187|nr:uncharacterized protein CGCA056_v000320 [Colletotrichum aenigma]KAF5527648.1 hypothetical protein CGCA056_v000320 [Colletotrichum aenigma]